MESAETTYKNSRTSKIVFVLSFLVTFFWVFGNLTDVYHYAFLGAIFELLWLPVVLLSFLLPMVCIVLLIKEKFSFWSLYIYAFLMVVGTITVLLLKK